MITGKIEATEFFSDESDGIEYKYQIEHYSCGGIAHKLIQIINYSDRTIEDIE